MFWTLTFCVRRSLLPSLLRLEGIFCSWRGGQAASGWLLGTGDLWLGWKSEKMRWRIWKHRGIWKMRGNNFLLSIFFWCCLKPLGLERIQVFISDAWCAVKLAQVDRALRYLRCGNPDLFPWSFCVIYPGLFVLFSRLCKDQWYCSVWRFFTVVLHWVSQ